MEVLPEDEIMLITKQGVIIRSSVAQIRVTGRNAQGVKLVQLQDTDEVTAVARVVPEDGADDGEGEDEPNGAESEREMLELTSEDDE
jgi:DNA gyrase subunit A